MVYSNKSMRLSLAWNQIYGPFCSNYLHVSISLTTSVYHLSWYRKMWKLRSIHSKRYSWGYMMTSSNGNISRVSGLSCGEFTDHRQWRGASMFSLICTWTNSWANNGGAGDLRRRRAHFDVIVMRIVSSAANSTVAIHHTEWLSTECMAQSCQVKCAGQFRTPHWF